MKFEKWQALGNDYLIVEAADLTFPLTRASGAPAVRPRTPVPARDGVLELAPPDAPGFVARLRIFNPDGSEAELSGNGAREAILYLRRAGWTDRDEFAIQTVAGEIRPTILGPTTCRVDMGRAALRSPNFPAGGADGAGEVAGRRFQHVWIGNPQCAIRVAGPRRARRARPPGDRPGRSSTTRSSPTARTCRSGAPTGPDAIRARIFERGVGETQLLGDRRVRRRRRLRAARRRLARHRRARRRRAGGRRRRRRCTWTSPAGRCPSTAAS